MIRDIDLFGREAISPNEKLVVKTANKTARDMFEKRYSPGLRDNWDIDVKELTLNHVERDVLKAILSKYPGGGKEYAKKIIC